MTTLKDRAEIYRQLVNFPPFQYLVKEVEQNIMELTISVACDLCDLRPVDKGRMMGMKDVITLPEYTVTAFDKQTEDSKPSE